MYPKPVEIRLAVRDIKSYPPMLNILKDEIEELRVPLKDKKTVQEISRKLKEGHVPYCWSSGKFTVNQRG